MSPSPETPWWTSWNAPAPTRGQLSLHHGFCTIQIQEPHAGNAWLTLSGPIFDAFVDFVKLLKMKTHIVQAAVIIGLATLANPAHADDGIEVFVQFAATLHAGATFCSTYSSAELDELRAQQRSAVAEMGMDGRQFDEVFEARYVEISNMLSTATPAEKAEVCEDMESFPIEKWR